MSSRVMGVPPLLCLAAVGMVLAAASCRSAEAGRDAIDRSTVERLVRQHARAWETGDTALAGALVHERALLAYPRRRVDRATWLRELAQFSRTHLDTRIHVHEIVVDGVDFAVEWQFATTARDTGIRTAVSDAIIGRVEDGRIILWKEYLDPRVPRLQAEGLLPLDEGQTPFPWPKSPTDP